MKFSRNALIDFGKFQTLLKTSVIAINDKYYIEYINDYAEEMLNVKPYFCLIGSSIITLFEELKLPLFFIDKEEINDTYLILENDHSLKWQKIITQIEAQEWFLLIGQEITSKETYFHRTVNSRTNNSNKDIVSLDKIVESLPELVYWKDRNCVYQGCNNHVAKLLNLDCPAEIIGKTDYDFGWSPERIKGLQDIDHAILQQGFDSTVEDIIPTNNANKIYLTHKTPLRDNYGNIVGILGVSTDITSQKIMEEELKKARITTEELERLNNIIKYAPDIIYWKDKDSIYRGGNNQLASIAGFKNPEDIIGKSDYDLPWHKQARSYVLDDQEVIESELPKINIEDTVVFASGKLATVISNKVPLRDSHNKVIGVLGIATDITDRKQMEDRLKQAKKMAEAANEAKSDFISNMQHDLMTPFSGIHGSADILYGFYAEKYPDLKEWLEPMMKSCEQWERVHYSMFDAIKLLDPTLSIEKFYLSDEINNVTEAMSAFLHFKHLKLLIPVKNELDGLGMIESNRLKIHLILLSLISNAIKFTDTGQIEIKVSCDESLFSIQIEDSGIGIPEDKFEYIFEKFTKLSRSHLYAGSFKGIGAGLYIAKHQASSIGGEIKVSSKVGKGSIFTLFLPKSYKL